jgi:hypothetical protein
MIKTALWSLQKALYARLSSDSSITAAVYDSEAEETAALPYIVLGDDTVSDFSTKTFDGEDITHTLHIWSAYKGKKEVKQLLDLVLQSVTSSPLTLTGFTLEDARRDFMEIYQDEEYFHGVLRLRFKIKQI